MNCKNRGLGIQGIEDGLDHQEIDAPFDQCSRPHLIGSGKLFEIDIPIAGVVHVRGY